MKNLDALLKRVELFEKLAVYGDRKTFLQTLAQQTLPRLVVPSDPNAPPGSGGQYYDPSELQPTVNPPTADRDQTLLLQKQLNAPAVREQDASKPKAVAFNPRVKAVQQFLNKQLVLSGVRAPITEDGQWGPETSGALKQWGDLNKMSGVPLTGVFTAAELRATV